MGRPPKLSPERRLALEAQCAQEIIRAREAAEEVDRIQGEESPKAYTIGKAALAYQDACLELHPGRNKKDIHEEFAAEIDFAEGTVVNYISRYRNYDLEGLNDDDVVGFSDNALNTIIDLCRTGATGMEAPEVTTALHTTKPPRGYRHWVPDAIRVHFHQRTAKDQRVENRRLDALAKEQARREREEEERQRREQAEREQAERDRLLAENERLRAEREAEREAEAEAEQEEEPTESETSRETRLKRLRERSRKAQEAGAPAEPSAPPVDPEDENLTGETGETDTDKTDSNEWWESAPLSEIEAFISGLSRTAQVRMMRGLMVATGDNFRNVVGEASLLQETA